METATLTGTKRLMILQPCAAPELESQRFADEVRRGLLAHPKTLPWSYFYDEAGSHLFERICQQPEYYLTRSEDAILREHADAMLAGWTSAPALIELGSGSASKTQRLIAAALRRHGKLHYHPIDVSPTALEGSAHALIRRFPELHVTGYVANYRASLAAVAAQIPGPKLWLFLGSSLGNYDHEAAVDLLAQVARTAGPDDRLLFGTDLSKDRVTLEAAYNDAQGVTAQFNKNLLVRINRELGADFDLDLFTHEARYREDLSRIEIHLVSRSRQVVRIPAAALAVEFDEGESIHTENSQKYTPEMLRALADRAGFIEEAAWMDRQGLFRVQRWRIDSAPHRGPMLDGKPDVGAPPPSHR
jgi:L-histidine Nalpha-methyltransferase